MFKLNCIINCVWSEVNSTVRGLVISHQNSLLVYLQHKFWHAMASALSVKSCLWYHNNFINQSIIQIRGHNLFLMVIFIIKFIKHVLPFSLFALL